MEYTSKVISMWNMFKGAHAFSRKKCTWDTPNVTTKISMFLDCPIPYQNKPPSVVEYENEHLN